MILCFSALCVLHSKDSSVIQKLEDPKNSGNFAKPRKIAKKFVNPEK